MTWALIEVHRLSSFPLLIYARERKRKRVDGSTTCDWGRRGETRVGRDECHKSQTHSSLPSVLPRWQMMWVQTVLLLSLSLLLLRSHSGEEKRRRRTREKQKWKGEALVPLQTERVGCG